MPYQWEESIPLAVSTANPTCNEDAHVSAVASAPQEQSSQLKRHHNRGNRMVGFAALTTTLRDLDTAHDASAYETYALFPFPAD